jgi:hypothetical protein
MTRRRAEASSPAKEDAREAIPTGELLQRLEDHALGKVEMSTTEVRAAEILLKKRLPDLSTVAMTARAGTLEEMLAALDGGSGGAESPRKS